MHRIPVEAIFFAPVQNGPGFHPTSCTMGTGPFFSRGTERPGRDVDLPPLLVSWSWKVDLYLYSPCGPTACTEPQCLYKGVLLLISERGRLLAQSGYVIVQASSVKKRERFLFLSVENALTDYKQKAFWYSLFFYTSFLRVNKRYTWYTSLSIWRKWMLTLRLLMLYIYIYMTLVA
jgi:hypothetical protein